METVVLAADAAAIAHAAELLRHGRLVAFPTETVYGLGANALDREAVRRVFAVKGRPAVDPLIVHVRSLESAASLVSSIPEPAVRLAARFWPGPLTLVMPRSAAVPTEVTAGLDTVAVRVPAHPVALALLGEAGIPVAAPSANLFSRPSPTRASHVLDDLGGRVDLILDGGPTSVGVESTVLDVSGATPTILRPGAVTLEMLRDVLPGVAAAAIAADSGSGPLRSPGLLDRHYSPRAPLTLYQGEHAIDTLVRDARSAATAGTRPGIIIAEEDREQAAGLEGTATHTIVVGPLGDPAAVAAKLYWALRELDAAGVDLILARAFPASEGLGVAVHDRLRRAAAGRIVTATS